MTRVPKIGDQVLSCWGVGRVEHVEERPKSCTVTVRFDPPVTRSLAGDRKHTFVRQVVDLKELQEVEDA